MAQAGAVAAPVGVTLWAWKYVWDFVGPDARAFMAGMVFVSALIATVFIVAWVVEQREKGGDRG